MTALAANVSRTRTAVGNSLKGSAGVAASTTIYKGSLVSIDGSGNLITTKATSNNCVGVALKKYDNSTGSAGDITGEYRYMEAQEVAVSTVTVGLLHQTMYAKDDNTVVATATTGPAAGILISLSGTNGMVMFGVFEDTDGTA